MASGETASKYCESHLPHDGAQKLELVFRICVL